MNVLMDLELKPDVREDVKATLKYMVNNRLPSGNYPAAEDDEKDVLVQWCRGAPGIALTLVKAAQVSLLIYFIESKAIYWRYTF